MDAFIERVYGSEYKIKKTALITNNGASVLDGRFHGSRLDTDRTFDEHAKVLGIDFEALPVDSSLLVIGSGASRAFEKELHDRRPDLLVVSVDPFSAKGGLERFREGVRQYGYSRGDAEKGEGSWNACYTRNFAEELGYFTTNAVAGGWAAPDGGLGPHFLPFKDSAFDRAVALHSLPQYLPYEEGELSGVDLNSLFLQEVERVIKPGGQATIYPFYGVDAEAINALEAVTSSTARLEELGHYYMHGTRDSYRLVVDVHKDTA